MTLADERLKELDNPSLPESERALLRCRVSADLIHKGQYETACDALGELWQGIGVRPDVKKLPPTIAAEVLLRCGALTGWLGNVRNVEGSQEKAKDLLSEALRLFQSQARHNKVSEAQYELGICYWRLGAHDEGRVVLREALKSLTESDVELKAKIHIRRTLIEIWENRYHEALDILREAEPVFESANDALKGRWHGQKALVLDKLATAERNADRFDRAIIEYTTAIIHYEQAGHERYCALNLNNLAMLLYKLGRYAEAHEHLDRAQRIFQRHKDPGNLAHVNETRARVFIAEQKYREANHIIAGAIQTFEKGEESAWLADALAVQGVVWARMGVHESSLNILRRAVSVAEESGALTSAGLAALTLIEEHGAGRLTQGEVSKLYLRADRFLKDTQDAEDIARLRACARITVRRVAGMKLHDRNFTFFGAVQEFEARMIEQALDESEGSVTRAAKVLGLRHQTLATILNTRHRRLLKKRSPAKRRLRSIVKKLTA
jgi:tetratricopeptide (TPR) repeat protein